MHEDSNGTLAGAGDLLIGVKWRFFYSEKSQLQLGIYPQLLVPSGDHARGLGEGRTAFVLPLVAQKNWEKWTLYGNVVSGGKLLAKRAITFTPAQCWSVKLMNG